MRLFYKIRIVIVLFLIPFYGITQEITTKSKKAIDAYNIALRSFSISQYEVAEQQLLVAIKADPDFIEAYLVLAEVYEDWNKPQEAINTYRKGLPINDKFYPFGYVRLANLQFDEGLYSEAKDSYKYFIRLNSGNTAQLDRARDGLARCEFALEAMKNPVDFKPVNLGPEINSEMDDYWPTLSADEKTLVITRLIPSDEFMKTVQEDFFISFWSNQSWSTVVNAGRPLNTGDNEGAQTISGDGRFMVFTACNRSDGMGRCDLYASERKGDNWSIPENLGSPVNSKFRETQPSITPDGRTLYFSSDRPGGKGGHDLWVSFRKDDGSWSVPENMGEPINTPGIEMSPFIHPDNQSLYYSSDGLYGLGGYDLFISKKDSTGRWQKPINLGYPINTNRDEIGLIVNSAGNKAYYSSDIEKKTGKDIYVFDLPEKIRPLTVTYMKGKVFDAVDKHLLRAEFELIDLETGHLVFNSFSDSITGEFVVSIPVNKNYLLNVSKRAYLFFSENFSLKNVFHADKPFIKDVPLQPLLLGSSIVLKNVFFETDSFALKNESRIELDKVVILLQANPGIKVEIGGYTDNTGNDAYNQKLSENRAKSVANYLGTMIEQSRIEWKGYGSKEPVSTNDTPEGRSQNRRTEMKIVD